MLVAYDSGSPTPAGRWAMRCRPLPSVALDGFGPTVDAFVLERARRRFLMQCEVHRNRLVVPTGAFSRSIVRPSTDIFLKSASRPGRYNLQGSTTSAASPWHSPWAEPYPRVCPAVLSFARHGDVCHTLFLLPRIGNER
jgi:hypothetical protein